METLYKRKKIIENIAKKSQIESGALAYLLICKGVFDDIIVQLDNNITITDSTGIIKKGYLTSEEQFVSVLEHTIYIIYNYFWFLIERKIIIELIFKSKEAIKLLQSKRYIGNNQNIDFYDFSSKYICVINFYKVLKKVVDKSYMINEFLNFYEINIEKIDIHSKKHVEKLFYILRLICLCNYDSFHLFYLFKDTSGSYNLNALIIRIELLIENTRNMQKYFSILLK